MMGTGSSCCTGEAVTGWPAGGRHIDLEDRGASKRQRVEDWLPELLPQGVLRDAFRIRLPSLLRWAQKSVSKRAREGRSELTAKWNAMLRDGLVKNRAELARREGLSRARVSQLLRP
jgi:hypothetical protein